MFGTGTALVFIKRVTSRSNFTYDLTFISDMGDYPTWVN